MKMKEVLERTGLTDRAVRLYIANELVAPECSRGYTGRNSFDFSEEDVEALQKIALLRKADFSIEQIKALQSGGEEAKTALSEYLEEKREEYHRDGMILEALADLPGEGAPNLDELCRRLTEGFREKKVPQADMKITWKERIERVFLLAFGFLGMCFYGITFLGIMIYYRENFLYPKFYRSLLHYLPHIVLAIPAVLFAWGFGMQLRQTLDKLRYRKRRRISYIAISLAILLTFTTYSTATISTMFIPMVYSETENPAYYLKTDLYRNQNYKIFPMNVPGTSRVYSEDPAFAEGYTSDTKYHYRYEDLIDPCEDVFAQWVLPKEAYDAEKERIFSEFASEIVYTEQWGRWTCVSLTKEKMDYVPQTYEYILFAYNDETYTVRYIYSYSMDAGGTSVFPYFLSLDWEN